jgi:hypothetical protein
MGGACSAFGGGEWLVQGLDGETWGKEPLGRYRRRWEDNIQMDPVAYPGIFSGGGGSTNLVEDRGQRERGSGGGNPLVRGSGGSCNLVQEISFHIVKFS